MGVATECHLDIRGVSKHFGGVQAIDNVSVEVNRGEIVSVIGPNGAGKTTLLNMISGFYHPDGGVILLAGRQISALSPSRIATLGVARTFQNIALFRGMSVLDNLMLGRHVHMRTGALSAMFRFGPALREEVKHREMVEDVIEFLDIQPLRKQPAGALAYGLQKRVELGRALAAQPQVLLLDEPMGGMNIEEKGGHGAVHPRRERRVGNHDRPDRARHGGGDGHFPTRRGPGPRPQDRCGNARRGQAVPGGRESLPGDPGCGLTPPAETESKSTEEATMAETTLPHYLLRNAREFPHQVAMREKEKGIWQQWTWQQYLDEVRDLALGLSALGFRRGDKLAILSDNRPQVYWAMVASQALGGMPVPLYQDSISRQLAYVVDHSDAAMVLAEDQEQVDKLLELKDGLPKVRRVIYDDPKGMRHYDDPWLTSFTAVQEQGRATARQQPRLFDEHAAAGDAEDVALICYTSGTTGQPKGAMLTHANLITAVEGMQTVEPYYATDETLAYLPPAWVGDTFWSLAGALITACRVNCPERPETVQANIREIAPHFLVAPPRIWENLVSEVRTRVDDASFVKRWLFNKLMPVGEHVARKRMEKEPPGRSPEPAAQAGGVLRFRPLARPPGFSPHPLGVHGRRPPRTGDFPVFSRTRHQLEAGVRPRRKPVSPACSATMTCRWARSAGRFPTSRCWCRRTARCW